jgi:hypothetical protein
MMVEAQAREPLVVQVGRTLVEGWTVDPACPTCGGARVYFMAYDATCCPTCNVWLDVLCPDPGCMHCQLRPDRPWSRSPREPLARS